MRISSGGSMLTVLSPPREEREVAPPGGTLGGDSYDITDMPISRKSLAAAPPGGTLEGYSYNFTDMPISRQEPAAPPPGGALEGDNYIITENYEGELRRMKNTALVVAGLQKLSRFFGVCALTWATVVLLGGFASSLRALDFYLVSILLLIEAARLSSSRIFRKLLYTKLFREKHRPKDLQFEDLQYDWASLVDLIGQVSSSLVAIAGFVLGVVRLCISGRLPLSDQTSNLPAALYTFYVLVILNPVSTVAAAVCRLVVRGRRSRDDLVSYHDEVYRRAMDVGMAEADGLEIIEFAFDKLANDHMRNIQALAIQEHNGDLIRYMYHSPNGVEMACQYLESNDVYKQQAAANLPGLWAKEKRIEKQIALLTAVSKKLSGAGKVAEGAANSLACLAERWVNTTPHPFLVTLHKNNYAETIVDTLVDLVVRPIRPSLVFQLRALEMCCRSKEVVNHIWDQDGDGSVGEQLCPKLEDIIIGRQGRQRTKIYAGAALYNLLHSREKLSERATRIKESLKDCVAAQIDPAKEIRRVSRAGGNDNVERAEPYIWASEKEMLNKLREKLQLEEYAWQDLPSRHVRSLHV